MEYNKIIAVTGLPGLYELISSKTDGAIVRSLDDNSTRFVSSRIHNFSHLESIEIYTVRENVNLVDVLKAMESTGEKLPDEKDNAALKNYFSKVYPDLDFSRVYSSDLKKMVKWYSVLKANDIEIKLTEPEEDPEVAEDVDGLEDDKGREGGGKAVKAVAEKAKKKEEARKPAAEKTASGRKAKAVEPAKKEAAAVKAEKTAAGKKTESGKGAGAAKGEAKGTAGSKARAEAKTAKAGKAKKTASKAAAKPKKG